jgi:DNA-binding NarL/FixJ family response regulator
MGTLSVREREVVEGLARGQSTKEIAYALGIADVTVRVLIRRAVAKLGVTSRTTLLAHSEVSRLREAVAPAPANDAVDTGAPLALSAARINNL